MIGSCIRTSACEIKGNSRRLHGSKGIKARSKQHLAAFPSVFFRPSPLTSALIPRASLIIHMQIIPPWQLCHSRGALLDSPLFFLFLPSTFLFIENEVLQLCINIVFQSHQLSVSETEIKNQQCSLIVYDLRCGQSSR